MRPGMILGIAVLAAVLLLPGIVLAENETVNGSVILTDLIATSFEINAGGGGEMFAEESNVLSVTVRNAGDPAAGTFDVSVNVSGSVYLATVAALAGGDSVTVTVTDTVLRAAGSVIDITVLADSGNTTPELSEDNNSLSVTKTVYNNGYKGKRWTGGGDISTQAAYEGHIGLVYSSGNSNYHAAGWTENTCIWTQSDVSIPEGAAITGARLYQGTTWNQMGDPAGSVDPAPLISFNGVSVTPVAFYRDRKGFGSYDYPQGLLVYNVTDSFSTLGNSMTITPESGASYALYGAYLVVVYEDAEITPKKIWINDECDLLYAGASRSVTSDEGSAYATFSGVDTADIAGAEAVVILQSGNDNGKSRFFFNNNEFGGFWADYRSGPQIGFSVFNVSGGIVSGDNEAKIQSYDTGSGGDNMYATNVILVTEFYDVPVARFSAAPLTGDVPLEVAFTDDSTGTITGWAWDFDNDGTIDSTDQHPIYSYTTQGKKTVNLTVSGPGGSAYETKPELITVGPPTIEVNVEPADVDFGIMEAGTNETGYATVTVSTVGGTTWSVTVSDSKETNKGMMVCNTTPLENPFEIANGEELFIPLTSDIFGFMTGTADEDRTDTVHVKQIIGAGDTPGTYMITVTFTGAFD